MLWSGLLFSQKLLDTGNYIRRGGRLGQVIIRAHLDAGILVYFLCLGREHQYGQVGRGGFGLQTVADFESVHSRQHNVQDNKVGRFPERLSYPLQTVRGRYYLVAFLL